MKDVLNKIYLCSHHFAETHYREFNELLDKITVFNNRKIQYDDVLREEKANGVKNNSSHYLIRHKQSTQIAKGYQIILERFCELLMEVNKKVNEENREFKIMLEDNVSWQEKNGKYTLLYKEKPFPINIVKVEPGYTQGMGYSIFYKGRERGKEVEIEKAKIKATRIFWEEIATVLAERL